MSSQADVYALQARIAALEAGLLLAEMEEIKGGAGSGNWGHAGRPGQKGGSVSRSTAMSRTSGKDAPHRQLAASGKLGKVIDNIYSADNWENRANLAAEQLPMSAGDKLKLQALQAERNANATYISQTQAWGDTSKQALAKMAEIDKNIDDTINRHVEGIKSRGKQGNQPTSATAQAPKPAAIENLRKMEWEHLS